MVFDWPPCCLGGIWAVFAELSDTERETAVSVSDLLRQTLHDYARWVSGPNCAWPGERVTLRYTSSDLMEQMTQQASWYNLVCWCLENTNTEVIRWLEKMGRLQTVLALANRTGISSLAILFRAPKGTSRRGPALLAKRQQMARALVSACRNPSCSLQVLEIVLRHCSLDGRTVRLCLAPIIHIGNQPAFLCLYTYVSFQPRQEHLSLCQLAAMLGKFDIVQVLLQRTPVSPDWDYFIVAKGIQHKSQRFVDWFVQHNPNKSWQMWEYDLLQSQAAFHGIDLNVRCQ